MNCGGKVLCVILYSYLHYYAILPSSFTSHIRYSSCSQLSWTNSSWYLARGLHWSTCILAANTNCSWQFWSSTHGLPDTFTRRSIPTGTNSSCLFVYGSGWQHRHLYIYYHSHWWYCFCSSMHVLHWTIQFSLFIQYQPSHSPFINVVSVLHFSEHRKLIIMSYIFCPMKW